MTLDAGDLVLLPYPHTDLSPSKRRPALVVTPSSYNVDSQDVIVAFVTSRRQEGPWSIPLTKNDLVAGNLIKQSWIRVDRLATLDQRLVQKVVARLQQDQVNKVCMKLGELLT